VRFQRSRLSANYSGRGERHVLIVSDGTGNVRRSRTLRQRTIRHAAHRRCARLSTRAPISQRASARTIRLRRRVDPRGRTAATSDWTDARTCGSWAAHHGVERMVREMMGRIVRKVLEW